MTSIVDLSSNKRAQLALRFFTYGVMTIATIVLTVMAIFYAMGYRFNQNSLAFEQGGLMQFRSTPEGAQVLVDGKLQPARTPGRAHVAAGSHTIEMRSDGYRSWRKTVDVNPGQLLWLNYTRLIPEDMQTIGIRAFPSLASLHPSPDHKWLLLQETINQPHFTLVDVNDEKKPTFSSLSIPEDKLTKREGGLLGDFSVVEWDSQSRYVLVQHVNGATREFIRIDRSRPGETVNINQLFRLNVGEVHFAGSNSNVVYAKTEDVLRRLDLNAGSASAALVTGLQQFSVYSEQTLAFVAEREVVAGNPATKQQIVGILERDKEQVMQTLPLGRPLKVAMTEYFRNIYVALSTGEGKVLVLRDPSTGVQDTAVFASFNLKEEPRKLTFAANGRMVLAAGDSGFSTYDLELNKASDVSPNVGAAISRPLGWLDDFYLWTDAGDKLHILEFDGNNQQYIAPVAAGLGVTLSHNSKVLFSVNKDPSANTFVLQASRIVKG